MSSQPSQLSQVADLSDIPHFIWSGEKFTVLVLGTAHVSARSVEDVRRLFSDFQPDIVAVELCHPRFEALTNTKHWQNADIGQIIRQKKLWLLFSSLMLSVIQKKMGAFSDKKPGEELLMAVKLAEENGAELLLADREVRITLSRAWNRIGFFSRLWLISNLLTALLVREKIDEEEVEKLKQQDVLEEMLQMLPRRYEPLREVILSERDAYIAEKIRRKLQERLGEERSSASKASQASNPLSSPLKLFAVVGAGHLPGIKRRLESGESCDLSLLNATPRPSYLRQGFSWLIAALFLFGLSALLFRPTTDPLLLQRLAFFWIGSRSIGAGLGALAARARPLTLLVTVVVAPVSYFLGFLGVRLWMLSALTEVRLRRPKVEDFERVAQDTGNWRAFLKALYGNRILHLFFVIWMVSFGLTIGNIIFLKVFVDGLFSR